MLRMSCTFLSFAAAILSVGCSSQRAQPTTITENSRETSVSVTKESSQSGANLSERHEGRHSALDVGVLVVGYRETARVDESRAGVNAVTSVVSACAQDTGDLSHLWLRYRVNETGQIHAPEAEFSTLPSAQTRCVLDRLSAVRYPSREATQVRLYYRMGTNKDMVANSKRLNELDFDIVLETDSSDIHSLVQMRRPRLEMCMEEVRRTSFLIHEIFTIRLSSTEDAEVSRPPQPRAVAYNRFTGVDRINDVADCLQTSLRASGAVSGSFRIYLASVVDGSLGTF